MVRPWLGLSCSSQTDANKSELIVGDIDVFQYRKQYGGGIGCNSTMAERVKELTCVAVYCVDVELMCVYLLLCQAQYSADCVA